MIKFGQKIEILRMHFVEGKAKKQIARELNLSKNTVKTYINEFLESKKKLIEAGVSKYELIENMVDKPKYNSINRSAKVMTDEIKEKIRGFINENELKRSTGKLKMCMSAQDMYEDLIEQGFSLSYSSVAQYVQKYKENEYTFEAFVDAHIKFFEYIGGVPKCMVYDNMKVAVAKFVGRTEKEATIALKQLSVYYGFNYRFCNIRSGNEKGHVKNSVDFVRRKAFSNMVTFDNFNDVLKRLAKRLEKYNNIKTKYLLNKSPMDILNVKKNYLLKLMPTYSNCIDTNFHLNHQEQYASVS